MWQVMHRSEYWTKSWTNGCDPTATKLVRYWKICGYWASRSLCRRNLRLKNIIGWVANKARWLVNSKNGVTNPITSDKLKCQRPCYVASHFLCCCVIRPHALIRASSTWLSPDTVCGGCVDRATVTGDLGRCLSLSIDWARRPDDC